MSTRSGFVITAGLHGSCVNLRLSGAMTVRAAPEFQEFLAAAIRVSRPPQVVIDLTDVSELGLDGLPLLAKADLDITAAGGMMILAGMPGHLRLSVGAFRTRPTVAEAIRELTGDH